MTRAWDIVAYTYNADTYCPTCIARVYALRTQSPLDGLAVDNEGNIAGSPESVLAVLADDAGIDRMDETTFDSGDFPKVVFASQVEDTEHCGSCGREL